jgi:hypothetical protein
MWGKRIGFLWGALLATLALGTSGAWAATIPVTCSGLQGALNSANTGDVIELSGICTTTYSVTNAKAFTLEGVGNAADGTPSSGFNGSGTAGPLLSSPTSGVDVKLTIKNLLFENGKTNNAGAAIFFQNGSSGGQLMSPTITDDVFRDNSATDAGGAVLIETQTPVDPSLQGPIVLSNDKFIGNSSQAGGAVALNGSSPFTLTGNTFTGNSGASLGGALYLTDEFNFHGTVQHPIESPNHVTLSGNVFGGASSGDANTANEDGGAAFISIEGGQPLALTSNRFIGNALNGVGTSPHVGGALYLAPQGGEPEFNVTQKDNIFTGNVVTAVSGHLAGGGGEWADGTSLDSTADVFTANKVQGAGSPPEGGGLGIKGVVNSGAANPNQEATFVGRDDLFMGNSVPASGGWGGAIYTGFPIVTTCTAACPGSHLTLQDSTVTGNSVDSSSGEGAAIWGTPTDTLSISNSIVYGNRGMPGAAEIFGYGSPSYSHSDLCTTSGASTPLTGTGNICKNPALSSTGAETSTSPTIDKGSNALVPSGLTTDLAGDPRITVGLAANCPKAIVDMGAYEFSKVACGMCHIGHLTAKKHKPESRSLSVRCRRAGRGKLKLVVRIVSGTGKHRSTELVRLKSRKLKLKAGKTLKVKFKLPNKVLAALKAGKRCTLVVTLNATASNGITSRAVKKFKL